VAKLVDEGADPRWRIRAGIPARMHAGRDALVAQAVDLRASVSLTSPALRHALRLAVAVPAADVIARLVGLPRSYWVPLTVAVVLKPDIGSLFSKGVGRVVGTIVGVGCAGFVVAGLHPDTAWTVVALAVSVWGAYAFYQSNFAIGSSFVAAVVLLLLSVTEVNTLTTAGDRLLDTALGGAVALTTYLVWPTWSNGEARRALARLAAAQRSYLAAVLSAVLGEAEPSNRELAGLARQARLAWTGAQATVARSRAEPTRWRVDGDVASGLLAALLRVVRAVHGLRSEAAVPPGAAGLPALRHLGHGLDQALGALFDALAQGRALAPAVPLRQMYESARAGGAPQSLLVHLDEVVDAVNTAAHLLELHSLEETVRP
jgi:uncharacterized membrane protein YccC